MNKYWMLLIFLFFGALACTAQKMEAPPQPPPYSAPKFTIKNLSGREVSLKQYRDKPVIVNFWATWCVPCVAEMPELDRFYRAKKNEGLAMLMINLKESKSVIDNFVSPHGFAFEILMDENGKLSENFQVFGLPTTFFIDGRGMIVYTHMGRLTKEILYAGYATITNKKSPSPKPGQ
ncbi:hypothetical protein MNBD_NITROSPINAE02-1200 [hydrothermal vent metagenome]|uniref:Thioredoxin domain-containing protein n=1 Tax=hydrothermal vent metagenome TaxID=652676 RepID=A0A3B1CNL0_9ZZZZ